MSGVDESTTMEAMIMFIDEKYLNTRILKFMKTQAASASKMKTKCDHDFVQLISAITPQTQIKEIVGFLCWLDSCGEGRRDIVHEMHCAAVGMENLSASSTEEETWAYRFAKYSRRSNHL